MEDRKKTIRNIVILLIVCLLIMGASFYFSRNYLVVQEVRGDSMNSTLENEDYMVIFRTKKVKYDDIIVFEEEANERYLVKRVVGLEGDKIEIKFSWDEQVFHVYRNGEMVTEEHIKEPMVGSYEEISVTVPQGKIFFLGDNRNISYDSHHGNIYAEVDDLVGVVFMKYKGWKIKFL